MNRLVGVSSVAALLLAVPAAAPAAAAPVAAGRLTEGSGPPVTALAGHDVLVGYGRVGALVGAGQTT